MGIVTGCGGASPAGVPSPSGNATATAAPAASPTTAGTMPGTACPFAASVCDFARQTEARLSRGDVAGIIGDAPGRAVTCTTGVNPGLGADFPLCTGAVAGEVRFGFEVGAFQSEGGMTDRAGLAGGISNWLASIDPARSDRLGSGAVRAFTIGCPDARTTIDCRLGFSLVFSAIHTGGVRDFLMLVFTPDAAGTPKVVGLYTGLASLNMLYLTGGRGAGLRPGEPTSPPVQYMPLGR